MNDLLELKGELKYAGFNNSVNVSMPAKSVIKVTDLKSLKNDLERLDIFWNGQNIFPGALVSVYYNRIIPKSRRIKCFFSKGSESSNEYVRGIRFADNKEKKHIITYYIEKDILKESIKRIQLLIDILESHYNGEFDGERLKMLDKETTFLRQYKMSKSYFKNLITDMVDIVKFDKYENNDVIDNKSSYITLFDVDMDIASLMQKLGVNNTEYKIFSNDTIYIGNSSTFLKIKSAASYLISMALPDLATYNLENLYQDNKIDITTDFSNMPNPMNEPVIGVIDTLFDTNVYFEDWVQSKDCLNKDISKESRDYEHATEVCSIIVDGSRSNPKWDDECGFFRVRHFGVAKAGTNSSYDIINKIKEIVKSNGDIHVWNLSLGSTLEISENYISPEAAMLDEIQSEYNVVFVIAGTNMTNDKNVVRIGAPADSINSIVVNAVDKNGNKASYSRKGKVLSFFVKPDVCAFGGDKNGYINVCTSSGMAAYQMGTSFAAPWISRKLCYLIDKLGLSREIAKALIIDSAVGWKKTNPDEEYMGYGVVPTKITDVLYAKKDEIKFYIEGNASSYYTYAYNLPVPLVDDKFPFYAKAVLCYFPKCIRSQGVDYTSTELDIQFGRLGKKDIKSINRNTQGGEEEKATNEETARNLYRKWDNVKVVVDEIKNKKAPRKSYGSNLWGIKITNKARLERNRNLKFGIVVTLKEMYGKNRMQEFINQCQMRGWIVNNVNIENRLNIYAKAEEEIKFE